MFVLERDLVVSMEDVDTHVKLYSCKAGQQNTWDCSPGEQIVFIEDKSNCFEINGWFLFNRHNVMLAGEWSDTCCPATFAELAWDAVVNELVRENADLKYRVSFLECKLKEYQDSNPVNSKGLDVNFSSISECDLSLPSYDIYGSESEKTQQMQQKQKKKLLPPQPLP